MTTAASDDLICRVRAYLAGLEPPVPADELTDEEVGEMTMEVLGCTYQPLFHAIHESFRLKHLVDATATPPGPPPRPH
jgi:hypothetical protein